ncbi:ABC-type multidrug transport system ATPase subunit [Flavobacterium tiangeerense]|uniref:ABC-type multidrug transport system ATPase subunit n=1 Tax=Flavobacterium tiangeerense TaxID=459471 RepID=A0ABY3FLV1_9FLAO|nr:ATP-binding cassette domain-containing protein [Flavobacterium tiangeerense]TWI01419.1 ABC-type multidrug transport system ATPase subunit [Flavobacterium tiangeerense]
MTTSILEVDSVQKQYNGKIILSDVYLKCETGTVLGLLGRNGSGKSTLLKIIFGIEPADFKFVRVGGKVLSKTSELLKEISYLPQDSFISNSFSVQKTIQLSIAKENVKDFYADAMIQSMLGKKIKHLSGGELRYLEIKLIFNNDSKFVLLDEPYNGLSPIMIENINALITTMSAVKGILISDHNYQNVIQISTKLALMKDGKMHHLKDKNELIEKGYLKSGML